MDQIDCLLSGEFASLLEVAGGSGPGLLPGPEVLEFATMPRAPEDDLVYFLHIPKTSGMSLYHSMVAAFGMEAASPHLLWDDLVDGTYRITDGLRMVAGHFGGFLPLWLRRWPRMVTLLRDPVARALSHINHVQRERAHPLHALAAGLTIEEYCKHPLLRRTVDNFQSRYLASLDFALALMPRPSAGPGDRPYGRVSVGFENALHSLDKETGLLEAAVRALDALDAVGICEAHGPSLRVFARALGWQVEFVEYGLNHASGQRKPGDLSPAELSKLEKLNEIDACVYAHAMARFLRSCSRYGIEVDARGPSAPAGREMV